MIARSTDWKNALSEAIRSPAELFDLLGLPAGLLSGALSAAREFPLRVPRGFAARMEKGNPDDPLLRQVLAHGDELMMTPGYTEDPVGDRAAARASGLLHKYAGRALLVLTGACAVHCRYCFRRHFPYARENPAREEWREALAWLAGETSVHEVILSGGDPLMLDDTRLSELVRRLEAVPHLRRLRIHTRVPTVLPERVDDELLRWLEATRLQVVMVMHVNHAQEIDAEVADAMRRVRGTGAALLNQTVLLRGINDNADALANLSEHLFSAGVMPYYLHLLDRVHGAAHFDVPEERAIATIDELRRRLPGYLVPRLVRETAGAPYKSPIG